MKPNYVLGICGNFSSLKNNFLPDVPNWMFHDAAAVLMCNGNLVCAIEEERLNRQKHTNKFPLLSIDYCLKESGISLKDLSAIAFSLKEDYVENELNFQYVQYPNIPLTKSRTYICDLINQHRGEEINPHIIQYVPHHEAHAYSTFFHSGFNESLVLVIDGQGEKNSFSIFYARNGKLKKLKAFPDSFSLGHFYSISINLLGYYLFDEYKVMGLAPYGNPLKYETLFKKLYTLLPEGEYQLDYHKIYSTFCNAGFLPRRKGENFSQEHKDFAAALQQSLEKIALHVIRYWHKQTGAQNLCMSGGVAHNCTLNGKIAYEEIFNNIFVHPASHDAGAAIGAAMFVQNKKFNINIVTEKIKNVFWGTDIKKYDISEELKKWEKLITYKKYENIEEETAQLLAAGKVIGWVQGKSEFGPRALGNRSILADPRPSSNKELINAMVKKREGYRPFAPSILEEVVNDFFILPKTKINLDFMTYNIKVKEEKKNLLGAVTHINNTARVQTVSQNVNLRYWDLINNFYNLTKVPVLLNTSFNNNAEPIVDNINDALTCFLTTGLDELIIDNYMISKCDDFLENLVKYYKIVIPPTTEIKKIFTDGKTNYFISFNYKKYSEILISALIYDILSESIKSNRCLKFFDRIEEGLNELFSLWEKRYLRFVYDEKYSTY